MTASLDDIEAIALETVARLPEPFRQAALLVQIRVTEEPDAALLADMDIEDPLDLTGLYDGVQLTEKNPAEPDLSPDIVTLFRQAILSELADRGNVTLRELVSHIVIHEFAHHFGWSDDDIATVDQWWE